MTNSYKVSEESKERMKHRKNYNLHESAYDKVKRMLNAMEPGLIIPIQIHRYTEETMIW